MLPEHPLRRHLSEEIHARPPEMLRSPCRLSHLAAITGEGSLETDHAHLTTLCGYFKVAPPAAGVNHFSQDFGPFRLKWERHTEFSSYTIIDQTPFDEPFKDTPLEKLPKDWLDAAPGELISACHVVVEPGEAEKRDTLSLAGLFDSNPLASSIIAEGRGQIWTDFHMHSDGCERYLIRAIDLGEGSLGRVAQRVLEISTYRMMAMLAFPLAKDNRPAVTNIEQELSGAIQTMGAPQGEDEARKLLNDLSRMAGEAEAISVAVTYRFSAARAYYELIKRRMGNMREKRAPGFPPAFDLLDRRLAPAMESCENLAGRLDSLSARIGRASSLLRTRVDVALEAQNRDLLSNMDRRARLQLRLQQTVEGLSVVAISYYLLSVISYVADGAKTAGWLKIAPDLVVLGAFPLVVGGFWWALRKARKKRHGGGRDF